MSRRGRHESSRAVVLGALALGLLIWAKLRLVTTIPRSALADPEVTRRAAAQVEPGARPGNSLAPYRPAPQRAVAEVPGVEPGTR